jgi:hypothetical protein
MSRVFAMHKVKNFDAWKPTYDADVARRKEAGLTDVALFRQADDPNNVLMVWDSSDPSRLKAMAASPELAAKMREAGVVSGLRAWIGESAG